MLNYRNAKSRYLQSINEQIAFIDYVQIHVIYRAFLKRLEKYYDVFYKKGILLQKNSNLYVLVQSVIYLVGFSLVIYFAGTDLANGRITVGQFTIIFTYMGIALSNTTTKYNVLCKKIIYKAICIISLFSNFIYYIKHRKYMPV